MQDPESKPSIDQLLDQLSDVLSRERTALMSMDASQIEEMAEQKALLSESLRARRGEISAQQHATLTSLHGRVQQNMILLAHARDFLANALGMSENRMPLAKRISLPQLETGRLSLRG